jgi:hypothetical protein
MSNEPKKSLPRIRTFAQDLELEREKHHLPQVANGSTHTNTPTPVAAAAIADDVKVPNEATPTTPLKKEKEENKTPENQSKESTVSEPTTTTETATPLVNIVVKNRKKGLTTPRSESGGTVITDNKKVSPNFFSAVISAVRTWVTSLKKKKTTPSLKYTVVDSERRKGIIQKATTKTGSLFTADSETLAEEVRRRQSTPVTRKVIEETDISWTPNTEVGYPLLPGATSNVQVEFKKRSLPTPEIIEPTVVVPEPTPTIVVREKIEPASTTPAPVIVVREKVLPAQTAPVAPTPIPSEEQLLPQRDTAPIVESATQRDVPTWATSTPKVNDQIPTERQPEPIPPETTNEETIESNEYQLTVPEAHYRIRSIGDVTKINTNYLSLGVVGAVIGLVAVIFILRAIILLLGESALPTSIEAARPLLKNATVTDVELITTTPEAFNTALDQTDTDMPGTREIRFLKTDKTLVSVDELAALSGLDTAPGIVQSATEIRFIHIGTQRGIAIEVTDPTNALGSLLEWETRMIRDIRPLFEITEPTPLVSFTDAQIQGIDVRIASIDDVSLVVYGFIDENTVLITESTLSFSEAIASN